MGCRRVGGGAGLWETGLEGMVLPNTTTQGRGGRTGLQGEGRGGGSGEQALERTNEDTTIIDALRMSHPGGGA